MDKAGIILSEVFAALLFTELLFYRHIKNKQAEVSVLNKKISESLIAYFLLVSLFAGWLYFGEDREIYLECRRETMICSYMRSSEFDKNLKASKTYDISRVQVARIKRKHRKRSSYYVIELLNGIDDRFELPAEFNSGTQANREAHFFNDFLQKKKSAYVYIKHPDIIPFRSKIVFFTSFCGIILALRLLRDLFSANAGKLHDDEPPELTEAELREQMKADGLTDEEIDDILNDTGATPAGKTIAGTGVVQRTRRD